MHDSPVPDASWWCEELGVRTPQRLAAGKRRTWSRDDFGDEAVSRSGVTLWQIRSVWSVTTNSGAPGSAFLYDVRFGRRPLAPHATLPLLRLRSWLLLPRSGHPNRPHVITVAVHERPPDRRPAPAGPAVDDPQQTANPDEPRGEALVTGLRDAEDALRDPSTRDLVATYALPYFAVWTTTPVPAGHQQVATCLPGDQGRGERALKRLRHAVWGGANRQPTEVLLRILIRHGLLTHAHVAAVRHDPRCGHRPEDVDPAAQARSPAPR